MKTKVETEVHTEMLRENVQAILDLLSLKGIHPIQALFILNRATKHIEDIAGVKDVTVTFEPDGDVN